jgi:hypothetical protein
MADLAKVALDVQDACNLTGVVHSWADVGTRLRQLLECEGVLSTAQINTHPVMVLFADKVSHLTGTQTIGHPKVMDAYRWAYDVARRQDAEDKRG